jgi:tetratricopeptide (TPR) repeat protein
MDIITAIGLIAAIITIIVERHRVLKFFQQEVPYFHYIFKSKYLPKTNYYLEKLPCLDNPVIGRETELQAITDAIHSQKQAIAIIAFGGVGKTTLVRQWLENFKQQKYGDFNKIFAWSFYSQGSHETQNSSAQFFTEALPFFGATEIPKLDEQKAQLLADLLFQEKKKNMLVLDGLEPLQYPIEQNNNFSGLFKDVALQRFLMAVKSTGYTTDSVVLMTSRQEIKELQGFADFASLDLRLLSKESGAKLLRSLEVQGTEQELQQASEENNGHALALVLLGKWLDDIRERDQLPPLPEDGNPNERHARRILTHYDKILQDVERQFLYLLGLFDRPMGLSEQQVLFEQAEFAQPLAQLSNKEFKHLIKRLTQANLLFSSEIDFDCHPIIRQYFGQRFKDSQPQAFRQAHLVLFEYYQAKPDKHQPDTLEELEPLYRAVVHGCLAGEYKKAREDVYRDRIRRGNEHYSYNKLGSYSQDLTAIAAFFPQGWSQPVQQGLSEANQAWLLAEAAFCLMSLGRLAEAVEPRKANLKLREKQENWESASIAARNLVDLYLPLGRLAAAQDAAQQAIDYAVKAEDLFMQIASHAYLATCLHRQGQLDEALQAFQQAEQIQEKWQEENPKLYSLPGFQYCALLLDMGEDIEQVMERGEYGLNTQTTSFLLDKALNSLTLARCYQALNQPQQAQDYFNQAVTGIREAGKINFIPEFLIDRANFYLQQQQYADAKRDLDEADMIIQRGDMKLYAVDWHLSMNNYQLAMNNEKQATEHKKIARELIEVTGYKLRLREL